MAKSDPAMAAGDVPQDMIEDGKVIQKLAEIAFIGAFLGQTQAAESIFHSLRILRPGNPIVDLGLAMVYTLAGQPEAGLSIVERTPGLDPDQGLVALCMGFMLRDAGHGAAADRKFTQALERGDIAPETTRELSKALRR
uniref:tetratricopeptide repeat protein n=1 Tax=Bordetella sputigena TaxID=1416810 RepID=UPI0039EF4D26